MIAVTQTLSGPRKFLEASQEASMVLWLGWHNPSPVSQCLDAEVRHSSIFMHKQMKDIKS